MLLESFYVWPWVESTHVLTLMLFVGTAVMMDLRLLGASRSAEIPASEFTGRMLNVDPRAGFADDGHDRSAPLLLRAAALLLQHLLQG